MNDNKIIKIPISYDQRKINEYGQGYVPCAISNRWLQFHEETTDLRFISVDVMTLNTDNNSHKICELVLNIEDIIRALKSIKVKPQE